MATLTLESLQEQINNLRTVVDDQNKLIESLKEMIQNAPRGGRDRGPVSQGEMTEAHAVRIMLGDLRELSHKEAALELKLSYGQIYSARKGYTFKPVYQRMIKGQLDNSHDDPNYAAKIAEQSATADAAQDVVAKIEAEVTAEVLAEQDKDILAAKAVDALEEVKAEEAKTKSRGRKKAESQPEFIEEVKAVLK